MTDANSFRKRIIICCDGSWQSAVNGEKHTPSNVTRLARSLERAAVDGDKTWHQVVWYDSGVATTSSWIGNIREGMVGAGMEINIIEAYNFVVLNWAPGDQILCFGFSRGAYTARSIAGLIADIGICHPGRLHEFHEVWELYKKNDNSVRFHGSDAWFNYFDGVPKAGAGQPADWRVTDDAFWEKKPHGDWALPGSRQIEVVGVYDTVSGLGLPDLRGLKLQWGPDRNGYHNVRLNPNVKNAFQALALDEHRAAWTPAIWHLPDDITVDDAQLKAQEDVINEAFHNWFSNPKDQNLQKLYNEARRKLYHLQEEALPQSNLLQVWFPGVHINIGGGSDRTLRNQGDLEEMSNITFAWMLDQIRSHVAIDVESIKAETASRLAHIDELNKATEVYIAEKKDADAKKGWAQWAAGALVSATHKVIPLIGTDEPNLERRDYGWGTGTIIDSYGLFSALNGSKRRTPGAYKANPAVGEGAGTNEQIHPTVGYRYQKFSTKSDPKKRYHPNGLGDDKYKRRRKDGSTEWEYVLDGVTLPEYQIRPKGNGSTFERLTVELADDDSAQYVEALDRDNGYE